LVIFLLVWRIVMDDLYMIGKKTSRTRMVSRMIDQP